LRQKLDSLVSASVHTGEAKVSGRPQKWGSPRPIFRQWDRTDVRGLWAFGPVRTTVLQPWSTTAPVSTGTSTPQAVTTHVSASVHMGEAPASGQPQEWGSPRPIFRQWDRTDVRGLWAFGPVRTTVLQPWSTIMARALPSNAGRDAHRPVGVLRGALVRPRRRRAALPPRGTRLSGRDDSISINSTV